eukprot:CAMPEP_0198215322 /NCGR_PEP_ID=MMETSP1445-20131203/49062_1 /TAXON_ID=36898 /ORGANISM="Pyramimonas sp., Strain CCMP2087" /LENGTH=41 /DNA_ID= /DNA_START= /DNA_END= /DNA_ORIENTATION=
MSAIWEPSIGKLIRVHAAWDCGKRLPAAECKIDEGINGLVW